MNDLNFIAFNTIKYIFRTCSRLIFLGKNEINRKLFKEKMQVDSYSIKQVFDIEKQDLAIFDKKALIFNETFYKNMKAQLIVNRFL